MAENQRLGPNMEVSQSGRKKIPLTALSQCFGKMTHDLSVCESASLSLQSDQVCDVRAVTVCHFGTLSYLPKSFIKKQHQIRDK